MRTLLITSIVLLAAFTCNAQRLASDKIYWSALTQYTIAVDTLYSKYSDAFKKKEIYLQKPEFLDSIPPVVNGYKIILITPDNQRKLYKEHRNKLLHTVMLPVAIEDSLSKITITPYHGELKKRNHYMLSLSDGITIYFKFDCDKQRHAVYKVMNWGI